MEFWLVTLLVILLGGLVLMKFGYERYIFFFLVRTKMGIDIIERIAKISPNFWRFLSDLAIFLSFGGIGALYLSTYRESQKNLYLTLLLVGLVSITIIDLNIYLFLIGIFFVFTIFSAILELNDWKANFIIASIFVFFIGANFLTNFYVSVALSIFGIPALIMLGLFYHAIDIVLGVSSLPGVSPLLPGTRGGRIGVSFPGYEIFIPWTYAVIAIIVTLVAHEFSHGILSRVNKIRLKSVGILTFGILPIGAFVEPDEEEMNSKKSLDRMQLFAIGSFANIVVGIISGLLLIGMVPLFSGIIEQDGIRVVGLNEGYPAYDILKEDMVVYKINENSTKTIESFERVMSAVKPDQEIVLTTNMGVFKLNTTKDPENESRAFIGIYLEEHVKLKDSVREKFDLDPYYLIFIFTSLSWISFFNINIALVNLLPIIPFDGGRMFREIISVIKIDKSIIRKIIYLVIAATATVFVLNMLPLIRMVIDSIF